MRALLVAASILSIFLAGSAGAAPASSPAKTFIDGIYRDYERSGKNTPGDRLFAAELAHLISEDAAIANRKGEPNLIDYNVLCNCQDSDGLKFVTSVASVASSSAIIKVTSTFAGKPSKSGPFTLKLIKTQTGWRVADVITLGKFGGSLLARLKAGLPANAQFKSARTGGSKGVTAVRQLPPTPTVAYNDASISLCDNKSTSPACEFVIAPLFRGLDNPGCVHINIPVFTCADDAIAFAEARGLRSIYIIYFGEAEPESLGGGKLPLDRFYTASFLSMSKSGKWSLKGQAIKGGLVNCPNYGLSSLQIRLATGLPQPVRLARYVQCDVQNNGQFTYRDPALVADPPFFRPGSSVVQSRTAVSTASSSRPDTSTVWSLGRARLLVEQGRRCSPDLTLGTTYCFDEAIGWLGRNPGKQSVDVVAMQRSWTIGSMIPYNSGQGWNIYKVSRRNAGFEASKQSHFGTQVRVPQGCVYSGVAEQAWFITLGRGRKAAVEAARYVCGAWNGPSVYARYIDTSDLDVGPQDISLELASSSPARSAQAPSPGGSFYIPPGCDAADCGGPPLRKNWLAGTSASIYGTPSTGTSSKQAAKPKRRVKR